MRNRFCNHPAAIVVTGYVALDIPGPIRTRQRRQGGFPFPPMAATDGDIPSPFQQNGGCCQADTRCAAADKYRIHRFQPPHMIPK